MKKSNRNIYKGANSHYRKVIFVKENPVKDELKKEIITIVGTRKYQKWAYFLCPCGCGEIIMLPLNKKSRPSWTFSRNFLGRPTVKPSVNKLSGCKSHFWITNGIITWSNY